MTHDDADGTLRPGLTHQLDPGGQDARGGPGQDARQAAGSSTEDEAPPPSRQGRPRQGRRQARPGHADRGQPAAVEARGDQKTTAKRTSTIAGNARAKAAKATKTEIKTGVKLVETYAERAVLVPVGAALAAREAIAQTVGDLIETVSSTKKTEAQLKRFEKRGLTARNQVEREAVKARKRVEHAFAKRRTDVEKAVSKFDRRRSDVEKRVAGQVNDVSAKIDGTVRQAVDAGAGIVNKARETVDSII